MQQTNQYKLNLIERGDTFSPQPINENMEAVEAALQVIVSSQMKMGYGTYKGTGTFGSTNPTALTFDFEAKLVLICGGNVFAVLIRDVDSSFNLWSTAEMVQFTNSIYGWHQPVTWNGTTVTWYNKHNAKSQMNEADVTYHYVAIG